jgi:hypothetical protein
MSPVPWSNESRDAGQTMMVRFPSFATHHPTSPAGRLAFLAAAAC